MSALNGLLVFSWLSRVFVNLSDIFYFALTLSCLLFCFLWFCVYHIGRVWC